MDEIRGEIAATKNNVTSAQNEIAEELIGTTLQSDILRNLVNEIVEEERRKLEKSKSSLPEYDLENVLTLLYSRKDGGRSYSLVFQI
jgi:hypothetical protein